MDVVRTWGTQKNWIFFKKEDLFTFRTKKHLIPFKILSIGGNTLVQSFFPLCEASLEMLKLDLLSASCEAVFTTSTVANLFPFNVFFHCREQKEITGG